MIACTFTETVDGFECVRPGRGMSVPAPFVWLALVAVAGAGGAGAVGGHGDRVASLAVPALVFTGLLVVLWFSRVPPVQIRVSMPRVSLLLDNREVRSATVVGASVSLGPGTIDLDPLVGPVLKITTRGWAPGDIEELVHRLRRCCAESGGRADEIPDALRELTARNSASKGAPEG